MRIGRAALWLCAALLVGCGGSPSPINIPPPRSSLQVPALDGGTIDLARYRGRIVVLHFFTTWDTGSQSDVEHLLAFAHEPDVVIIGIALDQDGRRLVDPWRRAMGVSYLIGLGGADLQTNVPPARRVPTTVILDPTGISRHRFDQPLQPGELASAIASLR